MLPTESLISFLCADWFLGLECYQLNHFYHLFVLIGCDFSYDWIEFYSGTGTPRRQVLEWKLLLSNCFWSSILIERELNSGLQLVQFLLLSDSFVCPWIYIWIYYQNNRNKHCLNRIFVFLLQININKYKTNMFQLEQTGHDWHKYIN